MFIDLSHSIEDGMPVYPGTPEVSVLSAAGIEQEGFRELGIRMGNHTGTHVDFPSHILSQGKCLDDFQLSDFVGRGIKVDCTEESGTIPVEVFLAHEERIREVEFVLIQTGWSRFWGSELYYNGFPVPEKEAILYLCSFQLKGIGIDCISIDRMLDPELPNHFLLLERGILIFENLAHLESLPRRAFIFNAFPLPILRADGAPVRALAQLGG